MINPPDIIPLWNLQQRIMQRKNTKVFLIICPDTTIGFNLPKQGLKVRVVKLAFGEFQLGRRTIF